MIKPTLSEVLQSDSVRRLLNQPNLVIKTIPLKSLVESDKDIFWYRRNGVYTTNYTSSSEISIFPADEQIEDANLLPSKIEHKKSEIALLPIKKKSCGHYEPCENIVCDVTLQQYVDKDGVSPMLALSIKEDEINAPVEKHCINEYCDALSIDHNRCRRALIKLHRCDRSHMCDICGITLKKWISRIYHRNCTRKKEYVHNNVDRLHLQKERMRMRELQILEIARMKKHDYSDPATAIEMLRRNEELIIIPQQISSQRPIVTTTSVSNTQLTNLNVTNAQPIKINSQITKVTNIFESVPLMVSSQSAVISDNTSRSESKVKSINQIKFSNLQQNFQLGSTSISASSPVQAQTRVPTSVSVSTSMPTLTLALAPTSSSASTPVSSSASVPTLTLTLAPSSASTPPLAPTSVPALALALAPSSASASTPAPTSVPTLALALAPTSIPTPAPIPTQTSTSTSAPASVTTSAPTPVVSPHKQYIRLAVSPQTTTAQPLTINNWIVSPSQILTTTPVQPKTFLAPIRVVPIANLISPPSLLHRTQGIPKFCIVAENLVTPATIPKSPSEQPAKATADTAPSQVNASNVPPQNPTSKARKIPKLMKAKKNFFCVYCSKNITTDWYFKMHIAKHKGEKLFFCNFCDESFSNNYDMKKHVTNQHIGQKELACDKCNYTCTSLASFKNHVQTHAICNLNKADVQSKKQRKLEFSEDKINHKLIRNTYKRKAKRIKCEDSQNERVEKYNNKKLLTINISDNAKTKGFNFVSVKKIVEPENFEQESAVTSR